MNHLARILLVIALLGVRTAAARDPERQLSEFAHRVWGGNFGIPTGVMALAAQTKYVTSLAESADGRVWMAETTRALRPLKRPGEIATSQGMSRAECESRFPDTWQTERRCQRSDDLEVRVGSTAILFDNKGSLWITTVGDGLRRAPHPSKLRQAPIGEFSNDLEQYTSKDGLGADYATAIFEDREGNIWVGTRNGVDQFRNSDLVPVNLGSEAIGLQMVPGDDGEVVGMGSGRLYRFRDRYTKPLVANTRMKLLYRDPIGPIWATKADGACRLVDLKCADELAVPAIGNPHWRLASDKAGRLWAYVQKDGAFVREHGHWIARQGARPAPAHEFFLQRDW